MTIWTSGDDDRLPILATWDTAELCMDEGVLAVTQVSAHTRAGTIHREDTLNPSKLRGTTGTRRSRRLQSTTSEAVEVHEVCGESCKFLVVLDTGC